MIYQNKVKAIGSGISEFEGANFLIIFGDSAPDELKDYCYSVDVTPINGTIQPGQTLKFDDQEYKITAVGSEVPLTLSGLGHCTIRFDGQTNPELAGTLYVEAKPMPDIKVGTVIQIDD
ncbi:PTS glucitol/sorbitol transporter subunit IIA [Catenisphaera adipataccumulans]|jgi:PTS system glucitol/sorbitol-specific IIA component|uniref:PTS system glucitol/sorbitol-specific IIA component n=1 Tax=Catenisphaera adipataccumulans TaxID=700500 RepID=A0A7W8CZD7_9FIRM|nr:PTS glucitol/sorbitol transporter subunit IIA [Catenisphaera adipataccumulans]MBB5183139.1 PTS system glucitol/sorbitol-specific IIA component [Catenisphaera adipataccumulans]